MKLDTNLGDAGEGYMGQLAEEMSEGNTERRENVEQAPNNLR